MRFSSYHAATTQLLRHRKGSFFRAWIVDDLLILESLICLLVLWTLGRRMEILSEERGKRRHGCLWNGFGAWHIFKPFPQPDITSINMNDTYVPLLANPLQVGGGVVFFVVFFFCFFFFLHPDQVHIASEQNCGWDNYIFRTGDSCHCSYTGKIKDSEVIWRNGGTQSSNPKFS